ncbi:hypothetical protein DUI87_03935 [Hirundo rustica rustica]|uniref:Uncharacterized protein n=1 Tax=Hirundo rustica rustica TaxID=333673 RepID=A0A3M0LJP5_HIRRU|nr:hypothetical protein DUI87_03935 [Hirundo rustica rustica]
MGEETELVLIYNGKVFFDAYIDAYFLYRRKTQIATDKKDSHNNLIPINIVYVHIKDLTKYENYVQHDLGICTSRIEWDGMQSVSGPLDMLNLGGCRGFAAGPCRLGLSTHHAFQQTYSQPQPAPLSERYVVESHFSALVQASDELKMA